ncbi:dihydrofolate reductase [Hutsoniella sourekii]|uniref:dihydrofolate reductase n=1 Tax=Hutsoniella sourekii TaxID=87650 RepID=UPI000486E79C|nr:dihydrofolate reductase [Hutsoniella sourekii]
MKYIYAQDLAGGIGQGGQMPWHLPNDLKHFKQTTLGYPVVMGRLTYESIGSKPLPKRRNIVLTRQSDFDPGDSRVEVVSSPSQIREWDRELGGELFVMGGGQIYQAFMDDCQEIYRTVIDDTFEADTYAPVIDESQWQLVDRQLQEADERNAYRHWFEHWIRKDEYR